MSGAKMQMMMSRGLTAAEDEKFDRLESRIAELFNRAGHRVLVCEATEREGGRMLGFVSGFVGQPLVSIRSSDFLAATDDELLAAMWRTLTGQ